MQRLVFQFLLRAASKEDPLHFIHRIVSAKSEDHDDGYDLETVSTWILASHFLSVVFCFICGKLDCVGDLWWRSAMSSLICHLAASCCLSCFSCLFLAICVSLSLPLFYFRFIRHWFCTISTPLSDILFVLFCVPFFFVRLTDLFLSVTCAVGKSLSMAEWLEKFLHWNLAVRYVCLLFSFSTQCKHNLPFQLQTWFLLEKSY